MKNLVIVGAGLLGEVVSVYFNRAGEYRVTAFAADRSHVERNPVFLGFPVVDVAELPSLYPPHTHDVFVAIGFRELNRTRARLFNEVKEMGYKCATYVHQSVALWPETTFGENVFVFEDNTIQPFVSVGDNTILWSGNHIGHHSKVGAHCFITSHVVVSGNCSIGDYSFLGVNATLRDSISVGARNVIGPGSLILRSTKDGQVFLPKGTEPREISSDRVKL